MLNGTKRLIISRIFPNFAARNKQSINLKQKKVMIKARIESVTFGDFSKKITLTDDVLKAYENTCYTDDNIIIDYVLSKCKTFRKYGKHLNEKFVLWFE